MILTAKDIGVLVDHTVWMRGKVLDVTPPYAVVHFPSLADSEQGPVRKVQSSIEHLSRAKVQSDPDLDLIPSGAAPARAKKAKAAKTAKTAADAKTAKAAKTAKTAAKSKTAKA